MKTFSAYLVLALCLSISPIKATNTHNKNAGFSSVAQNNKNAVINVIKKLTRATANGDVSALKRLTTDDFFKEHYPYSDAQIRKLLLSVPQEKRKILIDHIENRSKFSVVFSRARDYATVIVTNQVSGKEMTYNLIYEDGYWKICDYSY